MKSKDYILNWIVRNIDIKKIISKLDPENQDELAQEIFIILSNKETTWLNVRYNKKVFPNSIYLIGRNLVYDKNSTYHKNIDRLGDELYDRVCDDEAEETINIYGDIYNFCDCMNIFNEILMEDEWLMRMYIDYYINKKTMKELEKIYNLNRLTIKKRLIDVDRYIKFEFIKKINDLDYE